MSAMDPIFGRNVPAEAEYARVLGEASAEMPPSAAEIVAAKQRGNPPDQAHDVRVFTGEPGGVRRLATLEQVATMPDGTVVIWNDDHDDRQAGVLETEDGRGRVVRPISIGRYEDDWHLGAVIPPVWVVAFDDPPEVH